MIILKGQYKITIKYNGEQVNGSPFTCNVGGSTSGQQLQAQQLAKIVCSGAGLHYGRVSELNQVRVNEVNGNLVESLIHTVDRIFPSFYFTLLLVIFL